MIETISDGDEGIRFRENDGEEAAEEEENEGRSEVKLERYDEGRSSFSVHTSGNRARRVVSRGQARAH